MEQESQEGRNLLSGSKKGIFSFGAALGQIL
jgi:hypothetical protein